LAGSWCLIKKSVINFSIISVAPAFLDGPVILRRDIVFGRILHINNANNAVKPLPYFASGINEEWWLTINHREPSRRYVKL
jgi:hypothetical protein